jgi:hypothetical protein
MVGNKLTAKEEEAYRNKVRTNQDHHAVTTVLSTGVVVNDLGQHRQDTTKAQDTEEPADLGLPLGRMIMKTMKRRWEHCALLAEFAPHQYPKDSTYPMISKNTMDCRNHNHGSQIFCKQLKY